MLGINLESDFITKENIDNIWKYIKSKNVETAKIFYLYFINDLKLKEISEELEIKESTVKSNLYRMLKDLKKTFLGGGLIEK